MFCIRQIFKLGWVSLNLVVPALTRQIGDDTCSEDAPAGKTLFQVAMKAEVGMETPRKAGVGMTNTNTCQKYFDDMEQSSDMGDFAARVGFDEGAGLTGSLLGHFALKFGVTSTPLASPLSWGAQFLGETLIDDPDEKRIAHLQKGVVCLHEAHKALKSEFLTFKNETKAHLEELWQGLISISSGTLQQIATDSRECAMIMKCKAYAKLFYDQGYGRDSLSPYLTKCRDRAGWKSSQMCDSKKFLAKFSDSTWAIFNQKNHDTIQEGIRLYRKQKDFKATRAVLQEYALFFAELVQVVEVAEEWAAAICLPLPPKGNACNYLEQGEVESGLKHFKRKIEDLVLPQATDFIDELEKPDNQSQQELTQSDVFTEKTIQIPAGENSDSLNPSSKCMIGEPEAIWRHNISYSVGKGEHKVYWPLKCDVQKLEYQCTHSPCHIEASKINNLAETSCEDATWIGINNPVQRKDENTADGLACGWEKELRRRYGESKEHNWLELRTSARNLTYVERYEPFRNEIKALNLIEKMLRTWTAHPRLPPYHANGFDLPSDLKVLLEEKR